MLARNAITAKTFSFDRLAYEKRRVNKSWKPKMEHKLKLRDTALGSSVSAAFEGLTTTRDDDGLTTNSLSISFVRLK